MKHSERFVRLVEEARERVSEIEVDETREKLERGEDVLLIDVREDNEWNAAHPTGAIHLGKGTIERDSETTVPDKNTELILYCGGGYRSALATDALQRMGYTNVFSLEGGWRAWQEAGGEIKQATDHTDSN